MADDEPKWAGPQLRNSVFHPVQFKGMYESDDASATVSTSGKISNFQMPGLTKGNLLQPEGEPARNKGAGVLKKITNDADKFGHGVTLHADDHLHPWFAKSGFQMTGHDYLNGVKTPRLEYKPKDVKGI